MSKKSLHVVPRVDGGWNVRKSGAERATRIFASQKEAIEYARELARKQSGKLYIHRKDGTISDLDSFGSDPAPLRGKQ